MKAELKEIFKNKELFANKSVLVKGWVKSVRANKEFGFIDFMDGTQFTSCQIVFTKEIENFEAVGKLNAGSSLTVQGEVVLTPENKQPLEIKASKIDIVCATDSEYPLQKKRHTLEYLREIAYLRPRTNLFNAVFRVRSLTAFAIHKFFNERGFVYTHTPILTSSDCEGGSDLFRVTTHNYYEDKKIEPKDEYFGKKVYLTPTGQLEAETMIFGFKKVYTFGPTFRSENSNTTRHASEFWMIEPEVAYADLEDIMDLEEDLVKYIINYVLDNAKEEMAFFNSFVDSTLVERLHAVKDADFARITYTKAIEILEQNADKFEFKPSWGCDIQTEHERYLAETVFGKPVFVTDYPSAIKAFYMKQNDDGKTVRACDLLAPAVGEICGGSQREESHEKLVEIMDKLGLKQEDYWWYLNLRKFGSVPHSGFGLGFERILMYITGVQNIRDVSLYPRTPQNCDY